MFQKKHSVRRMMVAAVAAVGLMFSAMADRAHAFSFNDLTADVVVALYGNDTEALYNLGTFASVFGTPGANQTLDVHLTAASGLNPVRVAIFGTDLLGERVWGGTTFQASQINRGNVDQSTALAGQSVWAPVSFFEGNTISKSDPRSFSSRIDPFIVAGNGEPSLGGTWPIPIGTSFGQGQMFGLVGQFLNILETGEGDGTLHTVGSLQLVAGGPLGGQIIFGNPGPIPVPAAVVLFGSGLIGLVGVARRSLSRVA